MTIAAPRLRSVVATCCLALGLLACTQGRSSEDILAAHVETDFATMADDPYVAATGRLNDFAGYPFTALPGARGYGVRDVVALSGGGHLLIAVEPGEGSELLVLARSSEAGTLRDIHEVPFGQGATLTDIEVVALSGIDVPVVSVGVGELAGADRVYLALASGGPVTLRGELEGVAANRGMLRAHPDLPVERGSLGSDDRLAQLAATVALAVPAMASERGRPAVRGHLDELAAGNDVWLAQAAANLLTMRVE